MLRLLLISISTILIACSSDRPRPVAPAGKAADFGSLFDFFNAQQEKKEDETAKEAAETDSTSSEGGPDLIVQSPSVNDSILTPGQAFTLQATVHNQGDEQAAATMLHYYRSNNATITSSDTEVGADTVDVLDASATRAASIALTAPTGISAERGIYYGACVDSVRGESNTDNNCSSAVRITVSGQETPADTSQVAAEESPEVVDKNSPVSIPDKVFRAFLEAALDKQPGETITWGDMASLERLTIEEADDKKSEKIVSLTGIEAATNLTYLYLLGGSVLYEHADGSSEEEIFGKLTDISLLASLTKLEELQVREHPIENADALSQLTNLEFLSLRTHAMSLPSLNKLKHLNQLHLEGPSLTDISGLRGLTSLSVLVMRVPKLTDISVMQHLTNLQILDFSFPEGTAERLEDVTPLENLTLEYVDLRGSPLSENSIKKTIPALQARGTIVHWDF